MNKGIFIVGIAALGGLTACGSTTVPGALTMAARIVKEFPAAEASVFSMLHVGATDITNVHVTCVTESAGDASTAAKYTCGLTFSVRVPDPTVVYSGFDQATVFMTENWQAQATASIDSTAVYQWAVTPGTQAQVGEGTSQSAPAPPAPLSIPAQTAACLGHGGAEVADTAIGGTWPGPVLVGNTWIVSCLDGTSASVTP